MASNNIITKTVWLPGLPQGSQAPSPDGSEVFVENTSLTALQLYHLRKVFLSQTWIPSSCKGEKQYLLPRVVVKINSLLTGA